MLLFAVFDDSGPHPSYPLRHAHIVGKEDIVLPGSVELDPRVAGLIAVRKSRDDAAALALQFDLTKTRVAPIQGVPGAAPQGKLTLQTCLLPDRDEPYLLELELARHRIMQLLNKLEEWQLSDLAPDHPIMRLLDESRERFTAALVAHPPGTSGYTAEQARLARESLVLALDAGERLTMLAAEKALTIRMRPAHDPEADDAGDDSSSAPLPASGAPPRIGCVVHPDQFSEPLQRIVNPIFDFITVPMRWCDIEREEGIYAFTPTDRWIEWAVRVGRKPVIGGPVLDFSSRAAPEWLHVWEHDYDTMRQFAYEHVKRVVTRYRRTISRWTAISSVNVNEGFSLTMDQMIDLTRIAVLATRKLHPQARVVVEIAEPWGESGTDNHRTLAPPLYARLVTEGGLGVDAIGLRIQIGDDKPGRSARDLMQLSALLDSYAQLDRPLHVTAVGCPSEPPVGNAAMDPGYWRTAWSLEQQATWVSDVFSIIASKPNVRSICWQSLYDMPSNPEMPAGGLVTSDLRAKPALKRIAEFAAALREGRVPTMSTGAGAPLAAARSPWPTP